MSVSKTPSRFSRAFKRLSLKTAEGKSGSLPIVLEDPQDVVPQTEDDIDSRRFSLSSFRPPARWSTYSSALSGRNSRSVNQNNFNTDSKIEIKLECSNEDGVYRPGDILQGQVMLDGINMEGRVLRSVNVRVEGKAMIPRYEVRTNNFDDELERVIRTRQWIFYSSQSKIYPQTKEDILESSQTKAEGSLGAHTLPFTFELPTKDSSIELPFSRNIVAHCTPNWQKPTGLPPTCKIIDDNDEEATRAGSATVPRVSSPLKKLVQSNIRPNVCDISYSVIVEVQWQRNVLHSKKAIAKMDFIVHSAPPTTAPVSANLDDLLRRRRRQRLPNQYAYSSARYVLSEASDNANTTTAHATTDLTNGQTNWRTGRPTYLSQRLSRDLAASARSTEATNAASNREVAVFGSDRGPRGWYIERCNHTLATGQEVQIEFSYPAVPCLFMDKDNPFEIKVEYPTFTQENIKLVASDIQLNLLRHINSTSTGGRLCLESKNNLSKGNNSTLIRVSELKCQDTSTAPTDEYSAHGNRFNQSSQSFIGRFRIQSGLEQVREALLSSRNVTLGAISQDKVVHSSTPAEQVILPSFSFRGLSVEYSIGIKLALKQVNIDSQDDAETLPEIKALVEASHIQVQSRCSPSNIADTREAVLESRRSSDISTPVPSSDSSTSTLHQVVRTSTPEQRNFDEPQDPTPASIRPGIIRSTSRNTTDASPSQVNIHSALSQMPTEASPTFNADIKQSIAQNDHMITANTEQQPYESFEYFYENHPMSTAARERSGTLASCFSARTTDGLPPPYASPNLYDSRRL